MCIQYSDKYVFNDVLNCKKYSIKYAIVKAFNPGLVPLSLALQDQGRVLQVS